MYVTRSPQISSRRHYTWPPRPVIALAATLSLLAVGAIQGGWAMVTNPTSPLGMSLEFLERAPVEDYFWPGMFLLAIAAASVLAIPGLMLGWKWRWAAKIEAAVGYRWPWLASVSIGSVLLVFELIELFVVPFHPLMHPLLIAGSIVILGLPMLPSARVYLTADK